MAGYHQVCNCCGHAFDNAPGAYQYLVHLSQTTYYGVRMSPEATWALGGRAREFLGEFLTFEEWVDTFYKDWKPVGPDIIPVAYGWAIFPKEAGRVA